MECPKDAACAGSTQTPIRGNRLVMTETVDIAKAAELLDIDAVLVDRLLRAGVLSHEVVDGAIRIPLSDVLRRRAEEDEVGELMVEINQTFEELEN